MISVINESDFKVEHGLYAVKFWATWCQPCRLMDPMIKKLEEEFSDIKFLSIDIDQVPELAKKFEIKSIPTIILIKDNEVAETIIGTHRLSLLKTLFNNLIIKTKNSEENGNLEIAL